MIRFRVYVRAYCHLCEDMLQALQPLAHQHGVEVDVVDIEDDELLEARYGEKVPVLTDRDTELCHYFFDEEVVMRHLRRSMAEAGR